MSRCFICNYSDMGLSDIPIDDRTINNDVCSICQDEMAGHGQDRSGSSAPITIGDALTDDLPSDPDSLESLLGSDGLADLDYGGHGGSIIHSSISVLHSDHGSRCSDPRRTAGRPGRALECS